jgi:hypothetical protein
MQVWPPGCPSTVDQAHVAQLGPLPASGRDGSRRAGSGALNRGGALGSRASNRTGVAWSASFQRGGRQLESCHLQRSAGYGPSYHTADGRTYTYDSSLKAIRARSRVFKKNATVCHHMSARRVRQACLCKSTWTSTKCCGRKQLRGVLRRARAEQTTGARYNRPKRTSPKRMGRLTNDR